MRLIIRRDATALVVTDPAGLRLATSPHPWAAAATEWVADHTLLFWRGLDPGDALHGTWTPDGWTPHVLVRHHRSRPDLLAAYPWPLGTRPVHTP